MHITLSQSSKVLKNRVSLQFEDIEFIEKIEWYWVIDSFDELNEVYSSSHLFFFFPPFWESSTFGSAAANFSFSSFLGGLGAALASAAGAAGAWTGAAGTLACLKSPMFLNKKTRSAKLTRTDWSWATFQCPFSSLTSKPVSRICAMIGRVIPASMTRVAPAVKMRMTAACR